MTPTRGYLLGALLLLLGTLALLYAILPTTIHLVH